MTVESKKTDQSQVINRKSMDELPKQYDHTSAQNRWYEFWEHRGYFHSEPDPRRKPYTIVIPPPNVTGALHLGHALNNSLQDIMIRFKRMQGLNTLWIPGTDHAGIATQAVVEKRLLEEEKKTRHDLGRDALVERIWEWKEQYEARILGQLKQMGCSCDWQRTRFTLDETCARAVRETFFRLFKDGLIYRGKRLVNWDTFLQTTVSDDEVFHEEVDGHFWHIRYPVIDPKPGEPAHVTVATTRPETMLGDTAVAVHPDPAAALDKLESDLNNKLASAAEKDKSAIKEQTQRLDEQRQKMLPDLIKLRDMANDDRQVELPLLKRKIPLVADVWAKPELGSGCVKITPAHDSNDYEVGLRQNLPMINVLNKDGTLNEEAGPYQGMTVLAARQRVVEDLEKEGLMAEVEDRKIDLAHSDRSKTPIEPLLADQWFVKMDRLAQSAMDAVSDGRVKIFPKRYAKGYLDWLSEKRDWPIGRQLWWGHRIPVWGASREPTSPDQSKWRKARRDELRPLIAKWEQEERVAETRRIGSPTPEERQADVGDPDVTYYFLCVRDSNDREIIDALEKGGLFKQEEDVLDTWFSSALWPHSTLGWPEQTEELKYYYPTSTLITSRDIITLWVARMVLTGLYNVGHIPFDEVYIHPKILDRYGEGMSKSKGNGVDPLDVIEKSGADAMRFGLAYMTTESQDVRMPVDFECPHCNALIEQTKKNRLLPKVSCTKCGKDFSTQWAKPDSVEAALPRGAVVSERFELGRNFCNKLWNASRFTMMNLAGYSAEATRPESLAIEDRWILSRLATVTCEVTDALETYHFAEAARALYDFAWDEFCSFYVEMVKNRLQDESARPVAQRVLAHTLDSLLRLLHPMIPFITEEVWHLLGKIAPQRGLSDPQPAAESVMIAPWPKADSSGKDDIDDIIEQQFARFQEVLKGLREVRSRQNIPPKTPIHFSVHCDRATVELLQPMEPYFKSMAGAKATAWGAEVQAEVQTPLLSANFIVSGIEVFVDLADLIDVEAEIAKKEKEVEKLEKLIASKEKKLANEAFVARAPADVVEQERESLKQLTEQLATTESSLQSLCDTQEKSSG